MHIEVNSSVTEREMGCYKKKEEEDHDMGRCQRRETRGKRTIFIIIIMHWVATMLPMV
jgi:hypothetical protein